MDDYTFTLSELRRYLGFFNGDAKEVQIIERYLEVCQMRKRIDLEEDYTRRLEILRRQREDEEKRLRGGD